MLLGFWAELQVPRDHPSSTKRRHGSVLCVAPYVQVTTTPETISTEIRTLTSAQLAIPKKTD
jgi:hypothetical protein